jgi:dihydroorotate dehydrogenase
LGSFDIPVIGGGGIYEADAVGAMLDAGAIAVQLDSVLWKNPRILEIIDANLEEGEGVDIKKV